MTTAADPCLACPLPDCDESSPRCVLRRANAQYQSLKRRGRLDDAVPEVRAARNEWFRIWKMEHAAKLSETNIEARP